MLLPLERIICNRHYRWWIYAAVATGTFISVLDQSATSIVIPKISNHFGADIPTAQWLAIGYMLSVSALMMPAGALTNKLGTKTAWIWGLIAFTIASMIAVASVSFSMVLAAKIFMGIGAAVIQANGMAMIARAFPDSERGKAVGLHMTVVGIGAIGGPVIGGIIDSLIGWRAIFAFVALFSLIAIAAACLVLKSNDNSNNSGEERFDWLGMFFSAAGLVLAMLVITFAQELGWFSWEILSGLGMSVVLFGSFIIWEKKVVNPILPLFLFKSTAFSIGATTRFVSFVASSATFFLMPFFLVAGLGMSTMTAAWYLLPGSLGMALFGPISGKLSDKMGTRIPGFLGLIISAISLFIFASLKLDSNLVLVAIASGLSGMGGSIFMAPNSSAIMGSAGRSHYGIVSAFLNLNRNTAHVVGIAIPTAVVVGVMTSLGFDADLSHPDTMNNIGLRTAYVSGMSRAFQISTALMAVAAFLSLAHPKPDQIG